MELFIIGGIGIDTFSSGGPGAAIVQLLLIAAFGSLTSSVVGALGQGQIAGMIKLVSVFACIAIVIGQVTKAISILSKAFHVQL